MEVQINKPQDQAFGQFDGGKIKEQKPIGFPGEDIEKHGMSLENFMVLELFF